MLTVDFNHIPAKDHQFILDLGCGEGRHTIGAAFQYPKATVIGIDISHKDLSLAHTKSCDFLGNQGSVFMQGNGLQLPFPDNALDHIICSEVLEHIDNYSGFLKEIARTLKPGGTFTASVPRYWPEKICWWLSKEYYSVDGGHLRIFNAKKLSKEIQGHGFSYIRKHWAHALHSPFWWLKCIFWNNEDNGLVRAYHKLLVWDMMAKPWLTQTLEKWLNPILGKSIVMYFKKCP